MIPFANGGRLVEKSSELPHIISDKLFLDFETTSGDPKLDSLNPWFHCGIAGTCVTYDDVKEAWYVPQQVDPENRWLSETLKRCNSWVNHNIKYDAHVAANAGVTFNCELIDTLTLSKIIDSDRMTSGGYGLTALSQDWLQHDVSPYERRIKAFLNKSKDYGAVPLDIMGEYGCQDVLTTRNLWKHINAKCPDQCRRVWDTEIQLTSVLFDMEQRGLHVDKQELQVKEFQAISKLLEIEERLHDLCQQPIRPHVNGDCFDVLCNQFGLPVLGWTEQKNPSFDKYALASYLRHPQVEGKIQTIIELMLKYRKLNTLNSLYIQVFQQFAVSGMIHSTYNQAVRTGRMSCRQPNGQNNSTASKALIHPAPGMTFLSADYSQVEFRLIAHFINNPDIIAAYVADPDTDFHTWVANMCGVPRKPAKNINFAIGYGGGKAMVLSMLASNMDLVGTLMEVAGGNLGTFQELCERRALNVYNEYHRTLPELRKTTWRAARNLQNRGYVYNAYGRHRHLPQRASFRAFNSVVQSSAADLMKERTVATSPRFNPRIKEAGIHQVASVHDETLFELPEDHDPEIVEYIKATMESPTVEFRVPIRVSVGESPVSWAQTTID